MNEALLDRINGLAGHFGALDAVARLCASAGLFLIVGLAAFLGIRELTRDPHRGMLQRPGYRAPGQVPG